MTVSYLDIVSEYTQFAVCITNVVVYDGNMISVYIYIHEHIIKYDCDMFIYHVNFGLDD